MRSFVLALSLGLLAVSAVAAEARQSAGGRGQVVHTRRAPVVLHRAVPPFRGVHVYQR
ncbi:MAG: hypothetical protein MUF06_17615 [Pirellulaceae bacterium]|jgi:hypothetical protein|nr:hypothetical protein [Pirellulaceae bacterium]